MQIGATNVNAAAFHRSLHLNESDLVPLDPRCLFCSSTNRENVFSLQENPDVLLLQCQDCHATSASRIPTEATLAQYYGGYYDSAPTEATDGEVTFDRPLRLARRLANTDHRFQRDASMSILDFGGGDGTISYLLANQIIEQGVAQVNVTVVEYSQKIVASQDPRIVMKRVDSLEDIRGKFGYVIASAIIEHYSSPHLLLRDLLNRMEDGGLFYARTPHMVPIMRLLQPIGVNVDFTYPGHLHDLGQAFWESYFSKEQQNDYRILESKPSIVETTLRKHFLRTIAAYVFKAPWHLFGRSYEYIGGWEVLIQRKSGTHTSPARSCL